MYLLLQGVSKIKEKSVVMLSGGLDSAVNLAIAVDETDVALCVTFDYGQRSAKREIQSAEALSSHYKTAHQTIELPWLKDSGSSLSDPTRPLPKLYIEELDDSSKTIASAKAVWVPNRNGVFANIAASIAESKSARLVIGGFNAEEGQTFPDNTPGFAQAASDMFKYSTRNNVELTGYTMDIAKSQIARKAVELGVPLDLIWSCYEGGDSMCGMCEPCVRLKRAFSQAYPENVSSLRMTR